MYQTEKIEKEDCQDNVQTVRKRINIIKVSASQLPYTSNLTLFNLLYNHNIFKCMFFVWNVLKDINT